MSSTSRNSTHSQRTGRITRQRARELAEHGVTREDENQNIDEIMDDATTGHQTYVLHSTEHASSIESLRNLMSEQQLPRVLLTHSVGRPTPETQMPPPMLQSLPPAQAVARGLSNLPVIDLGAGPSNVHAPIVTPTEIVSSTYPSPLSVMTDVGEATHLMNSGLLDLLSCVLYQRMTNLGTMKVVTQLTSVELDPYDQLMFAVTYRHLEFVPNPPLSIQVLNVLHFYFCLHVGENRAISDEANDSVKSSYLEFESLVLGVIMVKFARVLFPLEAGRTSTLLEVLSTQSCKLQLDEISTKYPSIYSWYKLCFNIIHGGVSCVNPLPQLLPFDPHLQRYVNIIAKGSLELSPLDVRVTARNSSLPLANYNINVTIAVPTNAVAAITHEERTRVSSSHDPPVPQPALYYIPDDLTPNPAPQRESATVGRIQRVDTSLSQHSSDRDISSRMIESRLTDIESKISTILTAISNITEEGRSLKRKQTSLDQALSVYAARAVQSQVMDTTMINRTLLTVEDQAMAAHISEQPPINPIPRSDLSDMISRLLSFTRFDQDVNLLTDLQALLLAHGEVRLASIITKATIEDSGGRKRIIERLKIIP